MVDDVMFSSKYTEWDKVFLSKIKKQDDCIIFTGSKDRDGYGKIQVNNHQYRAHRLSWLLIHGNIPKNMCVCHICDVPDCINPDHLFLATNQENTADRNRKHRQCTGDNMDRSKLSSTIVKEARELYSTGETSIRKLASKYGVCYATMREALTYRGWNNG